MEPFPIPVRRTIAFGLTVVAVVSCRSGGGRATGTTGEEQERVDAPLPAIRSHDPGEVEMSDEYSFTEEQKAWMTRVARESVTAAAQGRDYTPPEPPDDWELVRDRGAAFVTLRRQGDGSLRGCIGHIIARIPLYECVAEMGRSAAIHDHRFDPVSPDEVDGIHIEISVLTPLEPVEDPDEIVVGRDGLVLRKGHHQGVFLPQVPVEQGWDRETYLDQLCYKAGVYRDGCWRDEDVVLEKYRAIVWEEAD